MDNKQSAEIGMAAGFGLAAMAQFPPSFLSDLPEWSRQGIGGIGLGLFGVSLVALIKPNWFWRFRGASAQTAPEEARKNDDDFVPMPEAAARAYGELRAIGSSWANAADSFAQRGVRENIYFAGALGGEVPIYGKHPPSRIYEVIDSDEFKRGVFADDGATFHYHGEKNPQYVEIAVKNSDLISAIEKMKDPQYDLDVDVSR
jgi:hypothetical protein